MNSAEFTCKCKKRMGWITENEVSEPCPECGRIYRGVYDFKNLTVEAVEIKKRGRGRVLSVFKLLNQG